MSISALVAQAAISLAVVTLYHLWVSRKNQPAPTPPPLPVPQAAPVPTPPPPAIVPPVAAPAKASPAVEPVPPEILAVIAAAIAVVVGRPHRVVSVQQAAPRTPEVNVWALEGRVEQFLSHRVR